MRPDVFVRRGGRAFAATCLAAGAADGAGATGVAFAVVTGADDGGAGGGDAAGFGGSVLGTAFTPVGVGAGCTGCGVCERACPTEPASIWIEPAPGRGVIGA